MENGNFVTESAPQKEKHSDENFYYIHSALNVNGEKRYVVVTVREHNDKSLSYYNHNVFNESEYKKIEDAFKPSGSEQFKAQPSISNKTSSFADSVSQKADNYKQQKIVNGTLVEITSSGKSSDSFTLQLEHCCQQQAYYKAGAEKVQCKAVAVCALVNYG